jgi:predicted ATP-grasp superfamily ATP-dependent carboligase
MGGAEGVPFVIVLGGELNTLSVTRALGEAGVDVVILDDGVSNSPARHSRYCTKFVRFPNAKEAIQTRWLDWLLDTSTPGVLLACCDDGLELLARHRRVLETHGHKPIEANDSVVLAMLDKQETYRLADATGIGVPRTAALSSLDGLEPALDEVGLPCGYKPQHSHEYVRHLPMLPKGWPPKGGIARDREELCTMIRPMLDLGIGMLLTEVVPGPADAFCSYYTYLGEAGQPLVHFTKRKLRQYPTDFGLGTLHVTKWQPDVAREGLHLLQSVGLRGLGHVEFKRDANDGKLKLIECNPRITMVNDLVRASGLDLAVLAFNRAIGRPSASFNGFRENCWMWFPDLDWKAFRDYRRNGELSAFGWLRSIAHYQHLALPSLRDPLPAATPLVSFGRRLLSRRARRPLESDPSSRD